MTSVQLDGSALNSSVAFTGRRGLDTPGRDVNTTVFPTPCAEPLQGFLARLSRAHCSPSGIADNVMRSMAPGKSYDIEIALPADQTRSTYWYHPLFHGSADVQVASGMAGAIIVEGDFADVPEMPKKEIVAKSLASGLSTTNKALFTTEVELAKLDPRYPWYLQEKVDADSDFNSFACGKKHFAFERERAGLKGLDWRNQEDIFNLEQKWKPFSLAKKQSKAVSAFLHQIAVDWGRIDFLRTGSRLIWNTMQTDSSDF